jgi:hypothetical protein
VPKEPWEHVSLDFIMTLPPSDGFDAILVVVDKLSKSMVLVPTVTTVTKQTERLYFDMVYCRHGLACKIISYRDVRFTSAFWQELHKLLQVRLAMSSSFHPQTDGQTERANRTLEEMIRHYVAHKQDDWARLLPALEFAYHTSKHRATGKSPFYICSGRDPVKFDELLTTTSSKSPAASEHVADMRSRASAAADSIALYNEAMEAQANKSRRAEEYIVGDLVLLSTRFFKPPADVARGRKLAPSMPGPMRLSRKSPRSPTSYNYHQARTPTLCSIRPYYAPTTPTQLGNADRPSLSLSASKGRLSMLLRKFYSPVCTVVRQSTWCTGGVSIC